MQRFLKLLIAAALAACGSRTPRPPEAPPDLPLERRVGGLVLLSVELPEAGAVIGGHYEGQLFTQRIQAYQLDEALRRRWAVAARDRGEALLRGAGYRVRPVGPATSDALRLWGVRFGVLGRVTALEVRTTGPGDPPLAEARADVSWEVLDMAAGAAIFGRSQRGTARFQGTPDSAVAVALDQSLTRMVADSGFLRALAAAPGEGPDRNSFERPAPRPDEEIVIAAEELSPVSDTGTVERVMAGVVALRGPDRNYGTGIMLTRDGLLLTTGSVVRHLNRVRARLANGVERPVRLLRRHGALNVALLQVACPGDCLTVDWSAPDQLEVFAQVIAVGVPAAHGDSLVVAIGRVGGQWGIADGVTLETDVQQRLMGGEPVASAASGKVVAVVSTRVGRQSALLLADVLRALRVRPPGPEGP